MYLLEAAGIWWFNLASGLIWAALASVYFATGPLWSAVSFTVPAVGQLGMDVPAYRQNKADEKTLSDISAGNV